MRIRTIIALALVPLLAGCTDEPNVDISLGDGDTTFAGTEVNYASDDEFATLSENGTVKLGLTSDRVYFEVSEALREHIDSEIETGMKDSDSRIARSISGAVRRGVQSALNIDIDFRLDEIRDVDYRDGELVFDFVDEGDDGTLRNIQMDDEPISRAFSDENALAFVEAFRRVKAGESVRAENVAPERPGAFDEKNTSDAAPDSAGGASF